MDSNVYVVMDGQPVAMGLAIALCEANPGVKLLAILEGSGHALETVAKGDRVAGDDAHVGIFDIDRHPTLVKEFLIVLLVGLEARELERRNDVVGHQSLPRLVD